MQLVTAQLSERVEHLMDVSTPQEPVAPAPPAAKKVSRRFRSRRWPPL